MVDCPAGSFCEGGQAQECDAGRFVASSNAANSLHCSECPAGYYCLRGATEFLPNVCPERYFCPSGTDQEVPFDNRCTPGYECPAGSSEPKPCDEGTYSGQDLASSCSACPAGAYCQRDINSGTDILLTTNENCPAGSYCEENTAYPTQCPAGKTINTEYQAALNHGDQISVVQCY